MGIHKPTAPAVNLSHYPNDTLDTDNCYPSNSMQPTFVGDGTFSGDTFSTGQIYASGFIARADFTCDGIALENWSTGDSGDSLCAGIWQSDATGQPTTKIGQTAEITLDGNATVRVADTTADVSITKGLYWVGLTTDANAQFIKDTPGTNHKAFQTNYGNVIWAGGNFAVNNYGLCWKKAFTYNTTLPDISSPTWNSFGPAMALRVK
tara:strand:+ start:164 stop:784 length:621 start_codon:yes stop_codon:yes gene_type:complete